MNIECLFGADAGRDVDAADAEMKKMITIIKQRMLVK